MTHTTSLPALIFSLPLFLLYYMQEYSWWPLVVYTTHLVEHKNDSSAISLHNQIHTFMKL